MAAVDQTVSVILPAWNAEKTLRHAVQSVLSTGYDALKILICVDLSDDSTLAVADSLHEACPHIITVLTHSDEQNHGAGATRNLGLLHADTEYIAFLDVDDAYLKNRFDRCLIYLEANPTVDFVYESVQVIVDAGGESSGNKEWKDHCLITGPAGERLDVLKYLGGGKCWHFNALTIRRHTIESTGMINQRLRLGQDVEWFIRLVAMCNGARLSTENPVAIYRRHSANRSSFDFGLNMPPVVSSACRYLKANGLKNESRWVLLGYCSWLLSRCTNSRPCDEPSGIRRDIWIRTLRYFPQLVLDVKCWKVAYWMLTHRKHR